MAAVTESAELSSRCWAVRRISLFRDFGSQSWFHGKQGGGTPCNLGDHWLLRTGELADGPLAIERVGNMSC